MPGYLAALFHPRHLIAAGLGAITLAGFEGAALWFTHWMDWDVGAALALMGLGLVATVVVTVCAWMVGRERLDPLEDLLADAHPVVVEQAMRHHGWEQLEQGTRELRWYQRPRPPKGSR